MAEGNLEKVTLDAETLALIEETRIKIREEMRYITDAARESSRLTAEDYNWRANC